MERAFSFTCWSEAPSAARCKAALSYQDGKFFTSNVVLWLPHPLDNHRCGCWEYLSLLESRGAGQEQSERLFHACPEYNHIPVWYRVNVWSAAHILRCGLSTLCLTEAQTGLLLDMPIDMESLTQGLGFRHSYKADVGRIQISAGCKLPCLLWEFCVYLPVSMSIIWEV